MVFSWAGVIVVLRALGWYRATAIARLVTAINVVPAAGLTSCVTARRATEVLLVKTNKS